MAKLVPDVTIFAVASDIASATSLPLGFALILACILVMVEVSAILSFKLPSVPNVTIFDVALAISLATWSLDANPAVSWAIISSKLSVICIVSARFSCNICTWLFKEFNKVAEFVLEFVFVPPIVFTPTDTGFPTKRAESGFVAIAAVAPVFAMPVVVIFCNIGVAARALLLTDGVAEPVDEDVI